VLLLTNRTLARIASASSLSLPEVHVMRIQRAWHDMAHAALPDTALSCLPDAKRSLTVHAKLGTIERLPFLDDVTFNSLLLLPPLPSQSHLLRIRL
jgi:hypothetical protein